MTANPLHSLADTYKYFKGADKDYTLARFRKEWNALTDKDKAQIRQGLADGSYNY